MKRLLIKAGKGDQLLSDIDTGLYSYLSSEYWALISALSYIADELRSPIIVSGTPNAFQLMVVQGNGTRLVVHVRSEARKISNKDTLNALLIKGDEKFWSADRAGVKHFRRLEIAIYKAAVRYLNHADASDRKRIQQFVTKICR